MHDQTAVRSEGIAEQFHRHPGVKAEVDDGYRGLANEFPGQISARTHRQSMPLPGGQEPAAASHRSQWCTSGSVVVVVLPPAEAVRS